MKWVLKEAKNGEYALQLNKIAIYSMYQPSEGAKRWINAEINYQSESYFMIGLGLGYHLKSLIECTIEKKITVFYFEKRELELFLQLHQNEMWWQQERVQIVDQLNNNWTYTTNTQILFPNVWLQAIGLNHPLFHILDIIKNNQIAYKKYSKQMLENFNANLKLKDGFIYTMSSKKIACLVAAGPSLDETIYWLKEKRDNIAIYAVGAVLKKLLAFGIEPDAIIISDSNNIIQKQLQESNYEGELFYLSTANHETVKIHNGKRYILFQKGYRLAEEQAIANGYPIIETGGSVATTTFSLLELLGYEYIVLFGQDLGFEGNKSHAVNTISKLLASEKNNRLIEANNGSKINTTSNLFAFLHWYNIKMEEMEINVFNTADKGAKIHNVPYINKEEFIKLIKRIEMEHE